MVDEFDRHIDRDPVDDQARDVPNRDLLHQHDGDRDPLDSAIVDEHERVDGDVAAEAVRDELVERVKERVKAEGMEQEPPVDDRD